MNLRLFRPDDIKRFTRFRPVVRNPNVDSNPLLMSSNKVLCSRASDSMSIVNWWMKRWRKRNNGVKSYYIMFITCSCGLQNNRFGSLIRSRRLASETALILCPNKSTFSICSHVGQSKICDSHSETNTKQIKFIHKTNQIHSKNESKLTYTLQRGNFGSESFGSHSVFLVQQLFPIWMIGLNGYIIS